MSLTRLNLLNIALMIGACVAAFLFPFELFLLAYAVLGPLHYLTQISWLHTRGYFTNGRRDAVVLVAAAVALLLLRFVLPLDDATGLATAVVLMTFAGALAFVLATTPVVKAVVIGGALLVAAWVSGMDAAQTLFLTFVPTIIHVFVFTAAFILYGALRGRSVSGIASLAVFVACAVSFFVYRPAAAGYLPSAYVRDTYALFADLNVELATWLRLPSLAAPDDVYRSTTGLALMRFIAFAYTYHYLNWFSKTSIIQWHRIPPLWSAVNVALWLGALGLYAWDYRIGMLVLFALSWLHVLLEFPLDHRTFVGIGHELGTLLRSGGPTPAAATAAAHARVASAGGAVHRASRPQRAGR
jgi:hypothetical protein